MGAGAGASVGGYTTGKQLEAAAAEVGGYTMNKESEAAATHKPSMFGAVAAFSDRRLTAAESDALFTHADTNGTPQTPTL